jgi:type VI secretion system protein VasD
VRRRWIVAGLLGLAAVVSACGGPPPPPPTVVNLTLKTTPDANPTSSGEGAPLAIRVYQLASPANFNNAEFFALYNDDAGALKTDLVRREDFLLPPGQSKPDTITPTDQVKAIGVFAGYRDFQQATWRATADVPAHKTTTMTVVAGPDGIKINAGPPAKSGS